MFPSYTLFSLILITLTAVDAGFVKRTAGKPTGTLSFQVVTKFDKDKAHNFVENDRARVQALIKGCQPKSASIDNQLFSYTAEIGVGSPPTYYTLIVDTGSSNTWVGANKTYVKTNTSHETGKIMGVEYGSGIFLGELRTDTVTLAPGLSVEKQSIGVAARAVNISYDGIIGLGPVDLTNGTIGTTDAHGNVVTLNETVPTVMDNLLSQRKISREVLGVYFIPYDNSSKSGELTFGGHDKSATTTPVHYAPVTKSLHASLYWGVDQSVTYGSETILPSSAGIVDTGTATILLASDAYQKYQRMTGATVDSNGLLKITPEQYSKLQPLTFHIGGKPFVLSPNAQILPRSQTGDTIYLVVLDMGDLTEATGISALIGYPFLERYYSVYDTTNRRVGFAETKYTFSNSN